MRLQTITVNNFKSLVNFILPMAKFSCLIGLNGVGKSTVLQFADFLAQQVRGNIKGWLDERHWIPKELHSRLSPHKNIEFASVLVSEEENWHGSWTASFNTTLLHCTEETIETQGIVLRVRNGGLKIENVSRANGRETILDEKISFSYQGSILSQLREGILPPALVEFKHFFSGIKSFDLLSPENFATDQGGRRFDWSRKTPLGVSP